MPGGSSPSQATPGGTPTRDETRARLLAAAAQLYAQHGHLGATTRAIAAEAGVNEVTLFRIFGTKDALLDEAIAQSAAERGTTPLPAEPRDPRKELTAWCRAELARLRAARQLMRQCFAEAEEHPTHVQHAASGVDAAAAELRRYVGQLATPAGLGAGARRDTAIAMLLSTLMADALGRDEMPDVFRGSAAEAPRRYAELFLDAIGVLAA